MKLVDVNVLVAALRNDHPQFDEARGWLQRTLDAGTPICVPDIAWAGMLRITSNPRAFPVPTPVDVGLSFMAQVRDQPSYVEDAPAVDRFARAVELCRKAGAAGDLVTDAYLAAAAMERGATVVSYDTDFARFEAVRWERPA